MTTAATGAAGTAATRSIIVKGNTIEDALGKGMALLNAQRGEITYEVLQEGTRGRNNLPGTPYRLRVTAAGDAMAAFASEGRPGGGDGPQNPLLFLTEGGDGAPPLRAAGSPGDNLAALSSEEFLGLLEETEARWAQPQPAQEEPADLLAGLTSGGAPTRAFLAEEDAIEAAIDGEVLVEVAPSRMEAFVTVTPPQGAGRAATPGNVHAALAVSGVCYGVDEAAVGQAVRACATRRRVAAGLAPHVGADAQLRFVTSDGMPPSETPPEGREVTEGTAVALKIPAGDGAPGCTVLGETLPPHAGRDLFLAARRGRNVRVSPDGMQLVAAARGIVTVREQKVHVESTLVLDRDVTAAQGAIEFAGDIRVNGSVGRGVALRAGGSVTITGNVDVAVVQAGGDVRVVGGIRGRGVGVVRALGGSLTCRFAEDARIEAAGDVEVEDYARNAQVRAGQRAVIQGAVAGGQVYGVQGVRVQTVGNEQGVATTLTAGTVLQARERLERIRLRANALAERVAALDATLAEFFAIEQSGIPLAPEQRAGALRQVEERGRARAEIGQLQGERAARLDELEEARGSGATVSITLKAFARTRIVIDESALELPAVTQYATFSRDAVGDIRLTALT